MEIPRTANFRPYQVLQQANTNYTLYFLVRPRSPSLKDNFACSWCCSAFSIAPLTPLAPADRSHSRILRKTSRIEPVDFQNGLFSEMEQLKELDISSDEDEQVKKNGTVNLIWLGQILPIKNLEKLVWIGDRVPYVDFTLLNGKKSFCEKVNCYSDCGEPGMLNVKKEIDSADKERTLYGFYFNGDILDNVTGKTIVHTQVFHHTKPLTIPDNSYWTIVTREYIGNMNLTAPIIFGKKKTTFECLVQLQSPGKTEKMKMMILFHGPLTIYAERIRYQSEYIRKRNCRYMPGDPLFPPEPSVGLARAATLCATNIAYPDPEDSAEITMEEEKVGMQTLDYVTKLLSVPAYQSIPGIEEARSQAMQAKEKVRALQKNTARYVPFLSKEVYETLLDELYRAGDVYRTHMYVFQSRNVKVEDAIESAELMVQKSADLVSASKIANKHAQDVLTVSKKSMARIKKRFFAADEALAEKKKAFDIGIQKYKARQAMKMFFAILKGIGSIIKGIFSPIPGAGVGDIMMGIATIGETIMKIVLLVQRIKIMMESNEKLMATVRRMKSSSATVTQYITDLDGAADLRLQIVNWDNMVDEVEQLLGKGEVATIEGCAQYRLGLSSLAAWGKALTEETIRQTSLVRDSLQKKEILRGLEAENERLTAEVKRASKEKKLTHDLYTSIYFQSAEIKMTLTETLREYCMSYFYYQLTECSPEVRPKFSDSMFQLLQKVSTAKIDAMNSLANMKGLPQPFTGIYVELTDKDNDNCSKVENCPVSTFKKKRELLVDIHTNHSAFSIMQRAKLSEITIELVGATTTNDSQIYLMLESSGDFRDMMGSTKYNFTSAPLVRGFAYIPRTGEIIYRGMVHDSFAAFFIETSPFTKWRLTMPHSLSKGQVSVNQYADISNVTAIRLHFSGSAIPKPVGKEFV